MKKISASLICANQDNILKDVKILSKYADWLHIDVMDGIFVPRLGMYPEQVASIRKYFKGKINAHMMLSRPKNYIETFAKAGVDCITVHHESKDVIKALKQIKSFNLQSGICLKLETPSTVIKKYIKLVDNIMLMSIKPGILGQTAHESIFKKIKEIKKMTPNKEIEIDGGVTYDTINKMIKNGATIFTCGTGILFNKKFGNLNNALIKLKKYLNEV